MKTVPETLYVFMDCEWLERPTLVGKLFRELLRGQPKYAFEFDRSWLATHPNFVVIEVSNVAAETEYFSFSRVTFPFCHRQNLREMKTLTGDRKDSKTTLLF